MAIHYIRHFICLLTQFSMPYKVNYLKLQFLGVNNLLKDKLIDGRRNTVNQLCLLLKPKLFTRIQ